MCADTLVHLTSGAHAATGFADSGDTVGSGAGTQNSQSTAAALALVPPGSIGHVNGSTHNTGILSLHLLASALNVVLARASAASKSSTESVLGHETTRLLAHAFAAYSRSLEDKCTQAHNKAQHTFR